MKSVAKIDIGLKQEVDRLRLPRVNARGRGCRGVAVGRRCPSRNPTLRLDPETGEVEASLPHLPDRVALAYGDGSVWTAGWTAPLGGFTGRWGEPDRPRYERGHDEDPARPAAGLLPRCGGRWVRVDGGSDEGRRLQDRSGRQVLGHRPTGPGASIGSFSDGVVWVGTPMSARSRESTRSPVITGRSRSSIPSRVSRPAPAVLVTARAGADLRGRDRRARRGRSPVLRSVRQARRPGPGDPARTSSGSGWSSPPAPNS